MAKVDPLQNDSGAEPLANLLCREVASGQNQGNKLIVKPFARSHERSQASRSGRLEHNSEFLVSEPHGPQHFSHNR
jgi:hypothetical protein